MNTLSRRSALKAGAAALGILLPSVTASAETAEQRPRLRFELYRGPRGRFWWRLKAGNGQVIATSGEGYNAKADCRYAIDRIREGAANATIDDLTG